ncbi:MAG TPA: hypothetical protein VNI02_23225 [Blastocatellia bacterium]|jgi:hypothetical protein|nr:hypothetical protein [Blastocatellia bacterium]
MKTIPLLLMIFICVGPDAVAQKRKNQPPARPRATPRERTAAQPGTNAPRMIGSTVVITTRNEDRITGTLLDLSAYSIRIRADRLESTIALDTIASISFGASAAAGPRVAQPVATVRPEFVREAEGAVSAFQSVASQLRTGADYTEYGRQLTELRRTAERFIDKNSVSDNQAEARVVALLAGALTDYTWARTVWTLKFGRSGDGSVYDTDSPAIADTLALYPDLRTATASGNKFSVDKLVSGLWKKAEEKTDRARAALSPGR